VSQALPESTEKLVTLYQTHEMLIYMGPSRTDHISLLYEL
jgi:hypothetical protein